MSSQRGPATTTHDDDVEVTWEDQQKICAFGRLSGKAHELQSLVSAKEVYYSVVSVSYTHLTLPTTPYV